MKNTSNKPILDHCMFYWVSFLNFVPFLKIDDITMTLQRKDMTFVSKWQKQYFMNECSDLVKYCFQYGELKVKSSSQHFLLLHTNTN